MKIKLNEIDSYQFNQILKNKDINMDLADLLITFIGKESFKPNIDDIENLTDQACEKRFFDSLIKDMDFDLTDEDTQKIANTNIKPGIKYLNADVYNKNPYNQTIKIKPVNEGNLKLDYLSYDSLTGFFYKDISVFPNEYYKEITNIGFFRKEYKYLALLEDDVVWMSINPNEIETMKPAIEEAKGNVLTFGLGLGYFAYMISLKKDVECVTIIENNPKMIDLFNKYLLPQFEYKEKIRIINIDAFKILQNTEIIENYNYAYFDLWHNPEDGLPLYLKIKKTENLYPNIKFNYWLEEGILALLRRCLISLLEEENEGSTDKNYLKAETFTDNVINKLHFVLKDYQIKSYYDIKKLLSDDSLKIISKKI